MSDDLRALVLTQYFEPAFRGGGPIQTIGALVRARPAWASVFVICSNSDLGESAPLVEFPDQWLHRDGFDVWYARSTLGGAVRAMVRSRRVEPRFIYVNSLFSPVYSIIPQLLHGCGLWGRAGLILAPRGELNRGALAIKAPKKRAFLALYRMLGGHRRVLWHASTELEAQDIRRVFGESVEIVVRENEANLPLRARRRASRPPGEFRLVYASRVVPKKGLLVALQALTEVQDPISFDVIGAFEDEPYRAACQPILEKMPPNVLLKFHGALPRTEVLEALHGADAMVFPTAGENFGHVIAEALSESCPVLCSDATPWTERLAGGAGDVVSPNTPAAWVTAIREFIASGSAGWEQRSDRAADAFDEWRDENKGAHILELARAYFGFA